MTGRPPGDDQPVIPERSDDDRDTGWGDRDDGNGREHDPDDERILRERPPHW